MNCTVHLVLHRNTMSFSDSQSSAEESSDSQSSVEESSDEGQIVLPTQQELLSLDSETKQPYVRRLKDGDLVLTIDATLEWRLVRREQQFLLVLLEGKPEEEEGQQLTSSLRDYGEVLSNNGYDPQYGIRAFLEQLMEITENIDSEECLNLACAWLVQLSYDTDVGETNRFSDIAELGQELHNLIIIALSSTFD